MESSTAYVNLGNNLESYELRPLYIVQNHKFMISIIMTLQWAWWYSKIPASQLFALNLLLRRRSKKTSMLGSLAFVRVIHRWPVDSPPPPPPQKKKRASNAESISIWWRHHAPWVAKRYFWSFSFIEISTLRGRLPFASKFISVTQCIRFGSTISSHGSFLVSVPPMRDGATW